MTALCVLGPLLLMSAAVQSGPATTRSTNYQFLLKQSNEQVDSAIDQLVQTHDVSGLERLGKQIEAILRVSNPSRYAVLTLRLANALGTFDLKNRRQYEIASRFASRALELPDKMSLRTELGLAAHLRYDSHSFGRAQAKAAKVRGLQTQQWLHAILRLQKAANEKWDGYQPNANANIPGFDDVVPGADPSVIEDPQRRATYAEAIAARNAKAREYFEYRQAQRWAKLYTPCFENYLTSAYSQAPENIQQLRNALKVSDVDQAATAKVMAKVENALHIVDEN